MVKHWGVTSLVALALLACLAGTEVEAQGQGLLMPSIKSATPAQTSILPGIPSHYHGHHHGHHHHEGHHHHHGHHHHEGHHHHHGHHHHEGHHHHHGHHHHEGHHHHHGHQHHERHHHHHGHHHHEGHHHHHNHLHVPGYQHNHDLHFDQAQQNPADLQTPFKPIFTNSPAQSCDVSKNTRITCGPSGISTEQCDAINCCSDGGHCYYGKAVTVQCTKDGQFIVVVARDATLPNIDLESISLLSKAQGCTHVDSNSEFAIYNFAVTSCGTVVSEEPGVIIYENRMFSSYEVETGRHGVITRDSQYELLFQCRYIGTTVQTVVAEVSPLLDPPISVAALGPIRVELRLGNGQCISKGCNEEDVAYASYYTDADYPVSKVLRDPVYVEVLLLEKTDPKLVLTLGRCWATTSPNPHSLPQWDILSDGCPSRNDNYMSSLVPTGPSSGLLFPSHYRRFLFKMFTFVGQTSSKSTKSQPLNEQVYIHCSTAVCTPVRGYSCEPICHRQRRDVVDVAQTSSEPKVVASVGPVSMSASVE
ncbi:zona pellucida sperm-binding protein 4-like [Pseudoliparis swirei]|uniref:zona pellucida sperm-binding protein 4-like n=1 Tax=Pseudoliparis swirei TaxID=2059687 RepID=UPI0024BDDBC6|nr:zona pellucida sperm-binding protein 4-like [Pseudoliparis swirei]